MGKEKTTTLILTIMICTSILLSGILLYGVSDGINAQMFDFEDIYFGRTPQIKNVLIPWQIVAITGDEEIIIIPGSSEFSKVMYILEETDTTVDNIYQWQLSELSPELFLSKGLYLNYGTEYFGDYLDYALPKIQDYIYPTSDVHGLFFDMENQTLSVIDNYKGHVWTHKFNFPSVVLQSLLDDAKKTQNLRMELLSLEQSNGLIFVPKDRFEIAPLLVAEDNVELDKIRKSFFNDLVSRKIEERDGTVIYTDGINSGLRIFGKNVYEYYSYLEISSPTIVSSESSLKDAVDFISKHGGWPSTAYLVEYRFNDPVYSDYTLGFSYYGNGYPILSTKYPLEVNIRGGKVLGYYRNIHHIRGLDNEGTLEVISYDRILRNHVKEGETIQRMYLAYSLVEDKTETLSPIWVIELEERIIYVNAYTGEVMR
ncbi:hypothetical protein HYG86_09810 [Alkalicella caledoniensis]|uniref:Regulatory protein YycH domain-containing protein n=1 Tax=Alkalicella caledoniensis TaxID=2731377 RepID=A0A7G9W8M7_ALKCA|nr:two-component system activity regulator YycH [Alkalicella caledoniensis]QNO15039.1 hypothetical protein HYG86_09810 [Alkalicella caledoniensis]